MTPYLADDGVAGPPMGFPYAQIWDNGPGDSATADCSWKLGSTVLLSESALTLTHVASEFQGDTAFDIRGTTATAKVTARTTGTYRIVMSWVGAGIARPFLAVGMLGNTGLGAPGQQALDIGTVNDFEENLYGSTWPSLPFWLVTYVTSDFGTAGAELWHTDPTDGGSPDQLVTGTP